MDINWYIVGSPGLKPDWFGNNSLLAFKKHKLGRRQCSQESCNKWVTMKWVYSCSFFVDGLDVGVLPIISKSARINAILGGGGGGGSDFSSS